MEECKPDLVFMDIVLKGEIDGIEAADQIRTRFNIPIVFVTAHMDEDRLERAKLALPFGYVLFSTVSDAIIIYDINSHEIVDVDDAACEWYGYSHEEFCKLRVVKFICQNKNGSTISRNPLNLLW
ncbi:MAG: response regulator [Candidatus Desulfatibia sp.]